MQSYSRELDGNVMVSQANAVQMDAVSRWVDKHGAEIRQQKPFMYAKLIGINDQSVDAFVTTPSESLSTFQQAIRLHWTDDVPRNNRIIEGQWWQSKPVKWQQLSVEQEVMTDMGLNIGDQLSFIISGNVIDFTIVASHGYVPGAGTMTFWVQMPAAAAAHINARYYTMASIEATQTSLNSLGELWQEHPSLRMVLKK
jgi:predicted lysophospholipase L1 biosynthesis ABC-type transport system permease subunit